MCSPALDELLVESIWGLKLSIHWSRPSFLFSSHMLKSTLSHLCPRPFLASNILQAIFSFPSLCFYFLPAADPSSCTSVIIQYVDDSASWQVRHLQLPPGCQSAVGGSVRVLVQPSAMWSSPRPRDTACYPITHHSPSVGGRRSRPQLPGWGHCYGFIPPASCFILSTVGQRSFLCSYLDSIKNNWVITPE